MRAIDADALVAKMNLAIAMLKRTMKNFDIEDDPECQMELKAYQDIRNGIKDEPTIEPEPCEDAVPRTSVEYICRKNTVSTNPCEHKYHDKFIQFMDDPEISDFGRWQLSNGFNTALVAVKCDLDKVPSVTPKRKTGKWITQQFGSWAECSVCRELYDVPIAQSNFCPSCGADMREGE